MYHAVIDNAKEKMMKTKEFYQKDMLSLRAGRANPQILDRIVVDYYGTATPLKQMGNINSPEPRLLTISLWDPKAIPLVEKAIQKSDLGMNPSNDGKVIRLVVPELNEERRKELTKVVRKGAEEAKVAMRNTRRDAMEQIKKLKKDSKITEDDQRKAEDELQKLTDAQIKEVDKVAAEKEKEIMEVCPVMYWAAN
jgi:ribosome recycling factor